jgi:hypothetical protein
MLQSLFVEIAQTSCFLYGSLTVFGTFQRTGRVYKKGAQQTVLLECTLVDLVFWNSVKNTSWSKLYHFHGLMSCIHFKIRSRLKSKPFHDKTRYRPNYSSNWMYAFHILCLLLMNETILVQKR